MMTTFLSQLLTNPWSATIFIAPATVLFAEVVTGSLRSAKQGSFKLNMLADFAVHQLAGYVMILVPALLMAYASHQGLAGVFALVQTPLVPWYAAQIASIDRNIAQLTGADDGLINIYVTALLQRLFSAQQPLDPTPPASPVAASALDLAQGTSAVA